MWATLETWLLGDGEVAELAVGEVLRHKGLRLSCQALGPSAETDCRASATGAAAEGDVTYTLRGPVVATWRQGAVIDIGRCLILLEPDDVRTIQAADGEQAMERFSDDFKTPAVGAMGEAVGRLEVVPDYEWDAFHLLDLRRDWQVGAVFLVGRQAVFVDNGDGVLRRSPGRATPMERLDVSADRDPSNRFLVDLEPTEEVAGPTFPTSKGAGDWTIKAMVREWHPEEGWGVLDSPLTPGGCWVHFSHIQATGYRGLTPGQTVALEFEPANQDGFRYRAVIVNAR